MEKKKIISEQTTYDFGNGAQDMGKYILLRASSNPTILAPYAGDIENFTMSFTCKNQLTLKTTFKGKVFYFQYCGITTPTVSNNSKISKGAKLGDTTNDVNVYVYDSGKKNIYFNQINTIASASTPPTTPTTTVPATGKYKGYDERRLKSWETEYKSTYDNKLKTWGPYKSSNSSFSVWEEVERIKNLIK